MARKVAGVKVSEARMKPTPTGRGAEGGRERVLRAVRSSVVRVFKSVAMGLVSWEIGRLVV